LFLLFLLVFILPLIMLWRAPLILSGTQQSEEEADAAWQECLGVASTDTRSDINKNAKSRGVLGDVLELFNGKIVH
jgi:hypothetical protein